MTKHLITDYYDSKIGRLIMAFKEGTLCALDFGDYEDRYLRILTRGWPGHALVQKRNAFGFHSILSRYLAGDMSAFEEVDVILQGTDFQKQVWLSLRHIPAGRTISYTELAHQVGRPMAVRALGHANSLNPIALVLPCHRVIGKTGALTGYAGGLVRKEWLLRHEGAL